MVKIVRKLPDGKTNSIYVDGYLNKLLDGFRNAIEKHDTSVVICIDGRSGMGKSTLANQIGIVLDPNYNINKIFYNPKDFLEGLANAKKGDFLLFDEAMLISSRSALSEVNKMVILAMSMIRSKNVYICFAINSIFDLDKNLAISRADLLLHVYGSSLIDRGRFASFFRAVDGQDRLKMLYLLGKKYYDYRKPKANFVGSFTKAFIVDIVEYEKRKQKGVNEFLKGTTQRHTNAMITRNQLIRYIINNKIMTLDELSEYCDISKRNIYDIMRETPQKPLKLRIAE